MFELIAALIVAAALVGGAQSIAREMRATRADEARSRVLEMVRLFAPGIAAASADPRALLTWQPLAVSARRLFPDVFDELDRAAGGRFPFSLEQLQAAHSRWTAEWLAWERAHDAEYKLKAATAEHDLELLAGSRIARARFEAVEREKLEHYQRRYEEYVRVAKSLQALTG